jgi:hypothetical protein
MDGQLERIQSLYLAGGASLEFGMGGFGFDGTYF